MCTSSHYHCELKHLKRLQSWKLAGQVSSFSPLPDVRLTPPSLPSRAHRRVTHRAMTVSPVSGTWAAQLPAPQAPLLPYLEKGLGRALTEHLGLVMGLLPCWTRDLEHALCRVACWGRSPSEFSFPACRWCQDQAMLAAVALSFTGASLACTNDGQEITRGKFFGKVWVCFLCVCLAHGSVYIEDLLRRKGCLVVVPGFLASSAPPASAPCLAPWPHWCLGFLLGQSDYL